MRSPRRRALSIASFTVTACVLGGTGGGAADAAPRPVPLRAHLGRLPASLVAGTPLAINPRPTTVPAHDRVTSATISFGDGTRPVTTKGLTRATHRWARPGGYTVSLSVTDARKHTVRTTSRLRVVAAAAVSRPAPSAVPPLPALPLAGRVTAGVDTAVDGVLLDAVPMTYLGPEPRPSTPPTVRTVTRADGRSALAAVPAWDYYVYVDVDPDTRSVPDSHFVASVLQAPGTAAGRAAYDIHLRPASTLTGRITGPDGPVAATLEVSQGVSSTPNGEDRDGTVGGLGFSVTRRVTTAADGSLSVSGLDGGGITYVTVLPADPDLAITSLPVYGTGVGAPLRLDLTIKGLGHVTGSVVTSDGKPAAGITVIARTDDSGREVDSVETTTTSDGTYGFDGLPAGRYRLTANISRLRNRDNPTYDYAIGPAQDVGVHARLAAPALTLHPGATLTGTVRNPLAVDFGQVLLVTDEGVSYEAATSDDGSYVLPGLPAGTFTVTGQDFRTGKSGARSSTTTSGQTTPLQDVLIQ